MVKGFSGIPGNLQGIMKQAQKMQEQLKEMQENAANITAEGSAGGGMVRVEASGNNRISSVSIEKEVVDPNDIEMLQDLIMAAANEALEKVQEAAKSELAKITGGINIPGLF